MLDGSMWAHQSLCNSSGGGCECLKQILCQSIQQIFKTFQEEPRGSQNSTKGMRLAICSPVTHGNPFVRLRRALEHTIMSLTALWNLKMRKGSLRHWISLWCQTVVPVILKPMGDAWRNTLKSKISSDVAVKGHTWKDTLQRVGQPLISFAKGSTGLIILSTNWFLLIWLQLHCEQESFLMKSRA